MNALAVLNAERIKLSTTRSPLWISAAVAVLSLMVAAIQGVLAHDGTPLAPEKAALGVAVFGVPVLMVLASMTVTAEYRSGMIRTTFIATPNRTLVLVAKAVVVSVFSAVYAAVMVIGSVLVARFLTTPLTAAGLSLSRPEVWRVVGAVALYAALAAVLGVAVGALLRAGPGAVAVLLLWPLVVEPMLGNLPNVGTEVGPLPAVREHLHLHRGAVALPGLRHAVGSARLACVLRGGGRAGVRRGPRRRERARRLIANGRGTGIAEGRMPRPRSGRRMRLSGSSSFFGVSSLTRFVAEDPLYRSADGHVNRRPCRLVAMPADVAVGSG